MSRSGWVALAHIVIFWVALITLVLVTKWVVSAHLLATTRLVVTSFLGVSFAAILLAAIRWWWKNRGRYDQSPEQEQADTEAFIAHLSENSPAKTNTED